MVGTCLYCVHIYMLIAVSGRCAYAYIYAHHAQRVNRMKTTEQLIIATSDLPVSTELHCGYNWKGLVAI